MTPPTPRGPQALALADEVALQIFARFGGRVPLEDLQSLARAAALDAADRWDGRGHFARFLVQRIRWRVLGALKGKRGLRLMPQADGMRVTAGLATERAADGLDGANEEGEAGGATVGSAAPETTAPASEMRAFLGRAAASFAVELDSAEAVELADPRIDLEHDAERMRVRRAVETLPEDQRMVIERHGYGNETFEDIAESEGLAPSTVHKRFGKALEMLRLRLGVGRETG